MSGPLSKVAAALEYVPELDANGKPYPWARPLAGVQMLLRDVVAKLNATPWTTSRTVSATFTAGETKSLNHGLGRVPKRWSYEDVITGDPAFTRTAWDNATITIRSTNAATATFRVE